MAGSNAAIAKPAVSTMAMLRRLWLNVHLWLGVGLAILLIPISISGGLLVFHDDLDALLNPQRYAVSGATVTLPPSAYLAKAADALAKEPGRLQVTALRFPEAPGQPLQAMARAQARDGGGRPRFLTVFLDPPTGAVLDVLDFRASFFGFLHVFHENLMLPQYNGRQIVGWAGTGMAILSLTGIWLWWPRNGALLAALRWRRSPRFTFNLHNMLGFWIAIPLAAVSITGIYLSFPQTARSLMASMAEMSPGGQRGGFNSTVVARPALTADAALDRALQTVPGTKPVTLSLPTQSRGSAGSGRTDGGAAATLWRIQLERTDNGEPAVVSVDDRSGQATVNEARKTGDRAASWIRWIHEGSHSGPVWAFIVFLTGVFPTVFAVTGIIMWLRRRADRKRRESLRVGAQLRPAE
ncbi:MAG: PepSY domain-containing protein [Rhodopseudomonas sp.]|nr:PepSY domain-containing protein [Rhodopseudomonas sp.]